MSKYKEFLASAELEEVFIDYLKNEFEFKIKFEVIDFSSIEIRMFPYMSYTDLNTITTEERYEIEKFNRLLKLPIIEKLSAIGVEKTINSYRGMSNTDKTREKIKHDLRFSLANRFGRDYKEQIEREIKRLFGVM